MQLPKINKWHTYFYCNQHLLSTDGFIRAFWFLLLAFLSVFFILWNKQHYKMNIAEGKEPHRTQHLL
jgi:hypothetical protein